MKAGKDRYFCILPVHIYVKKSGEENGHLVSFSYHTFDIDESQARGPTAWVRLSKVASLI
jgi:hypothetical protein